MLWQCTVCYGGVLCVGWCTVCYGGVLFGRVVYYMIWQCIVCYGGKPGQ